MIMGNQGCCILVVDYWKITIYKKQTDADVKRLKILSLGISKDSIDLERQTF